MDNEYRNIAKQIASTNVSISERGQEVVKDMGRLIEAMMNYNYFISHYLGKSKEVYDDAANKVVQDMIPLIGDLDVYIEALGVRNAVDKKTKKRLGNILNKIKKSKD